MLESSDGSVKVRTRALVHADGRVRIDNEGRSEFLVRRARFGFKAKLTRRFSLFVQPEVSDSRLDLLDACGTFTLFDELELRVGKSKMPLGLERLQRPDGMTFVERALPSELLPNRDVGLELQGKLAGDLASYAMGIYNGVPGGASGDRDTNAAKDFAGRFFLHPLQPTRVAALAQLGIGFAAALGDQAGPLPIHRTMARQTFFEFTDDAVADGRRLLVVPQGYWFVGPVGLLGEVVVARQEARSGTVRVDVESLAWQVTGSVVLGGRATYGGVQVEHPLDPTAGHYGALELAARVHGFSVDDAPFERGLASNEAAKEAFACGAQISWHPAPSVRFMNAFERTRLHWYGPDEGLPDELTFVTRLQVAFY